MIKMENKAFFAIRLHVKWWSWHYKSVLFIYYIWLPTSYLIMSCSVSGFYLFIYFFHHHNCWVLIIIIIIVILSVIRLLRSFKPSKLCMFFRYASSNFSILFFLSFPKNSPDVLSVSFIYSLALIVVNLG